MLPVVSGILPPDIRRNKQCLDLSSRAQGDDQHTLHDTVTTIAPGRKRLRSLNPFAEQAKQLTSDAHGNTSRSWTDGTWKTRLDTTHCRLREFIETPSRKPVGHDLARHSLVRKPIGPDLTRRSLVRNKPIGHDLTRQSLAAQTYRTRSNTILASAPEPRKNRL